MLSADLFRNITISPRVSFWISITALTIVLFNNHIYLQSVIEREKQAHVLIQQNLEAEESLRKRERVLREWETQLILRESEIKALIKTLHSSAPKGG